MKTFFSLMAAVVLMTSCLSNDETYRAGISIERPTSAVNYYYANNTSDSLIFWSYGNWDITDLDGYDNSWLTVPTLNGKGYTDYALRLTFAQNTTGQNRMAGIQINDTSHPGEARHSLAFIQYATRGDGSLGSAADVKSITGSDGSSIDLSYDANHRPTAVKIQKAGQTLAQLQIAYDDRAMQMTVTDNNETFTVSCENDFQPMKLTNASDTIGYFLRYDKSTGMPVSANYLFNFQHLGQKANTCVTYRFGYNGCSLAPDSLHNADSLYYYKNDKRTLQLGLTYAGIDNRCQTVDANQLLLGVEECDPYLLLSLFRYARNSEVISKARHEDVDIAVEPALNGDKSIRTLTVKRGSDTVVYTFNY